GMKRRELLKALAALPLLALPSRRLPTIEEEYRRLKPLYRLDDAERLICGRGSVQVNNMNTGDRIQLVFWDNDGNVRNLEELA
ncbi:unnamed protein product, partial [marine sediment metagenome]